MPLQQCASDKFAPGGLVEDRGCEQVQKQHKFDSLFPLPVEIVDRSQNQALMDKFKYHCALVESFGIFVPKHHLMLHQTRRARELGNPVFGWTFADEAMNKTLKAVLRNCPQCNFEATAFCKMRELNLRARGLKRKHGNQ